VGTRRLAPTGTTIVLPASCSARGASTSMRWLPMPIRIPARRNTGISTRAPSTNVP
jgi:hypothetical protein